MLGCKVRVGARCKVHFGWKALCSVLKIRLDKKIARGKHSSLFLGLIGDPEMKWCSVDCKTDKRSLHLVVLFYCKNNCHLKKVSNGRALFKKCKQLFEYQCLLLPKDIWLSKF
jgi:hypothetical protein